jgi:hypothetical protein
MVREDEGQRLTPTCFAETATEARRPGLRVWAGVVAAGAVSLSLGAGLELSKHLEFTYRNSSGVIGWLSIHEYPKQQEMFYILLALAGVPGAVAAAWGAWLLVARGLARRSARPVEQALKATACAFAPLTLLWYGIFHPDRLAVTLAVTLGLAVIGALGAAAFLPHAPARPAAPLGEHGAREIPAPAPPARFRPILTYGIVPILIYLGTYTNSVDGRIDLFHEGERLAPLVQLRHGGISFRDAFVQHGLAQDVTLGWLGESLFSPTLEGVRTLEAYLEPLVYVGLYLVGTQVFRWPIVTSLLLVVLAFVEASPLWPRAFFSRLTLGYIAIALLAGCVVRRAGGRPFDPRSISAWRILLAGVLTGAALWHSLEVGIYTLTTGALFLFVCGAGSGPERWLDRLRPLGVLLTAAAAVVVFGALPFVARGALPDLARNLGEQLAYQTDAYGIRFPPFLATLGIAQSDGWAAYLGSPGFRRYLPILGFVAAAAYLTHRLLAGDVWRSEGSLKLLVVLLAGVAFFRSAIGRADHFHLVFGSVWLWVFCLMPLDRVAGRLADRWRRRERIGLRATALLVAVAAFSTWAGFFLSPDAFLRDHWRQIRENPFARARIPTTIPGAGAIAIPADQAVEVRGVVDYIRGNTAPGERIYDFTNQGAYYYFSDRPSATRLFMMTQAVTAALEREVIGALDRHHVNLVLFSGAATDKLDDIWNDERRPLIAAYLEGNFTFAAEVGGITIAKRLPAADRAQAGTSIGPGGRLLAALRLPKVSAISVSLVSPAIRGFGPVEGPYPQWSMARPVRWMRGLEAEIRFRGDRNRQPFVLRMNVRSAAPDQRIDVLLNAVPIVEHSFSRAGTWERVVSREFTLAPENRMTFHATRTGHVDGRDLSVLFDEIAVAVK